MAITKQHPPRRRRYDSTLRRAGAERNRDAAIASAKSLFEEHGWQATTIAVVAERAGVSPKTIEATFGTKARLLDAAVDFAIRGDTRAIEMPQRAPVIEMEQAADAPTMLSLHASHLRRIHQRSARIAATVEQAAADPTVAAIWQRMNHNRAYAVRWATQTLLAKPGHRPGLTPRDAQTAFWITIDWGTYRTLTTHGGLTPTHYERWLWSYYELQLLDTTPTDQPQS